ncbi:hypothetical protein, partial [Thiolapillus sp.]|uniref:hypothetical protein n=1 Tax=Thiolapillus sp. TaxID=2017437 RepID=UPI003AF5C9BC
KREKGQGQLNPQFEGISQLNRHSQHAKKKKKRQYSSLSFFYLVLLKHIFVALPLRLLVASHLLTTCDRP